MTERQYIFLKNVTNLNAASHILRQIHKGDEIKPDILSDIIDQLDRWEDEQRAKIIIEEKP